VRASRQRQLTIGTNGQPLDVARMSQKAMNLATAVDLPQAYGSILAAGKYMATVWHKRHAVDERCVAGETAQLPARVHVPDAHGLIAAAGDSVPAARREADAVHAAAVLFQAAQLAAAGGIPNPDRVIEAAGQCQSAVGGKGHAGDHIDVSFTAV